MSSVSRDLDDVWVSRLRDLSSCTLDVETSTIESCERLIEGGQLAEDLLHMLLLF